MQPAQRRGWAHQDWLLLLRRLRWFRRTVRHGLRVEEENAGLLANDGGGVEVGPVLVADGRELRRRLVQKVGHAGNACERGCEDDGAVELQVESWKG